jgi:hypothetical protein
LVIDKHKAAVEPRKGTLAVSAMFFEVVAARMIYSIRFLKFTAVGMVGIDDGRCVLRSAGHIYLLLCSSHRYFRIHSQHHIIRADIAIC